jgi:hypothetical protein
MELLLAAVLHTIGWPKKRPPILSLRLREPPFYLGERKRFVTQPTFTFVLEKQHVDFFCTFRVSLIEWFQAPRNCS